jgi:hypothetical protein
VKTLKPMVMKPESNHVWVGGRWMPLSRLMRKATDAQARRRQRPLKGYEMGWRGRWDEIDRQREMAEATGRKDVGGMLKACYRQRRVDAVFEALRRTSLSALLDDADTSLRISSTLAIVGTGRP